MSKIIRYNINYYTSLKNYYYKNWIDRDPDYFDYRIKEIPEDQIDTQDNLIVVNDHDEIVGCQFVLPTKALVQGIERNICWNNDTLIDEEYRGDLGVELMVYPSEGKLQFGAGLSQINLKIQKKLRTPFLGTSKDYIILNWKSPFTLLRSKIGPTYAPKIHTEYIKIAEYRFCRINNISQLTIPNKGYWFGGESDVEFIRDAHFIEKRFLSNFNQYHLFAHYNQDGVSDMYFVVRIIHRKGFPVLSVVDVRYNRKNLKALPIMLKAANKIAMKSGIPFTLFTTTMNIDKSMYHKRLKINECAVVTGPKKINYNDVDSIIVTAADSDADFQMK